MKGAILAVAAAIAIAAGGAASAFALSSGGQEKVTICHAAGLAGTTKYVTLTIAAPAVFGPAGHFFENGTTRAGHEQDYFGACAGDETTTDETTTTTEPPAGPRCPPGMFPTAGKDGAPGNDECEYPPVVSTTPVDETITLECPVTICTITGPGIPPVKVVKGKTVKVTPTKPGIIRVTTKKNKQVRAIGVPKPINGFSLTG